MVGRPDLVDTEHVRVVLHARTKRRESAELKSELEVATAGPSSGRCDAAPLFAAVAVDAPKRKVMT